ncbi:kinase-like protein, partial [Auricularia subglabra TFB-10046 SS5]
KQKRSLEKEITALKLVQHPHVLRFYGLVSWFAEPCIVMPWIENGSLRQYLKKHPDAERATILSHVARALAHLHSGTAIPGGKILIHGDLHAGNVLIDDDGTALLGDFGLCKLVVPGAQASLSQRHVRPHGYVAYMAPELHDKDVPRSRATDVFAFGILIFETYAGVLPTQLGPSNEAIIGAVRGGKRPQRGAVTHAGLTDGMWRLACDCWKHDPGQRPTMEEAVERIRLSG